MPTTPSRWGGGYSADTLYFTTEFSGDTELNTGRIYLGGTLMAKPSVWEELPEPEIRDANYVYTSWGYDLNGDGNATRYDYAGETEYGGKTYHKFVSTYIGEESGERVKGTSYAMFTSRKFDKLAYPYEEALYSYSENPGEDDVHPLLEEFNHNPFTLYGFAEVPEDDHNTVVIERRSDTPSADPDSYVDLGLPSGTMWAKKNVGAESEEGYGYYIAWGETAPRGENWSADTPYDWAHAPFNNGQEDFDDEYFRANSGTWLNADFTLKPEYDAAHVIMGDGWRMPTAAQFEELCKAANYYTGTVGSTEGMFFVNRKDDSKRIFMPFAGYRYDSTEPLVNSKCYTWSSSLGNRFNFIYSFCFEANKRHGGEAYFAGNHSRCGGLTVRGVC